LGSFHLPAGLEDEIQLIHKSASITNYLKVGKLISKKSRMKIAPGIVKEI